MKKKLLIGIDPDVQKNGVAWQNGSEVKLTNLSFFELFDLLVALKISDPLVYVECGFLNASNWHRKISGGAALNAKIGERVGANFEVAKKICEMCEYLKISFIKIQPRRSKLNAKQFQQMTGIDYRTNQEQRDAYLLIFKR